MKKLIPIFIFLVMTVASQSPNITQTSQFVVGPINARDIKFWGDNIIVSRYDYELGLPSPYHGQLILLDYFGQIIWTKDISPARGIQTNQLVIKGDFCIFTEGDSVYKINKNGVVLKKNIVLTENASLGLQNQESGVILSEGKTASSQSKFFVYNEELDLVRTVVGRPGATYSVVQLGSSYLLSGTKYGGGTTTNISSHIAKYDTTGDMIWLKEFPDAISMRLIINQEKLYFCGVDVGAMYSRMIYGEVSIESGDTLWTRYWGAPYPTTYNTVLACRQIFQSPNGGFVAIGSTTTPGQQVGDYEPNMQSGLVLGYSPFLDQPWVKTTSELGDLFAGDWKDTSLCVFGNLGSPRASKAIIYSISGLTAMEDDEPGPKDFSLGQNYPNPFNPSTKIKFLLIEVGLASLRVYDLLGREVATLVNEELLAGEHEVSFEASALASGMYIYTLSVGRHAESKKMVLLR